MHKSIRMGEDPSGGGGGVHASCEQQLEGKFTGREYSLTAEDKVDIERIFFGR